MEPLVSFSFSQQPVIFPSAEADKATSYAPT